MTEALVRTVTETAGSVAAATARLGREVTVDGPALLGERAALAGLSRQGDTSCGGATRLMTTVDGWIALSLARDDDVELMPAWLETPSLPTVLNELWPELWRSVSTRQTVELVERAALLGLACSAVGETDRSLPAVRTTEIGSAAPRKSLRDVVVVDLSALWAGPLCADLLGLGGARIIKVESVRRPDGARRGNTAFYNLLHAGHESVALDLADEAEIDVLRRLLQQADLVIEASRPRALTRFGIRPDAFDGPQVWLSITGHGRNGGGAHRIAFGDDAAVAGGLVTADDDGLCFCCDAVADPATGLLAARAALDALEAGGRWLIDVALSRVAASMSSGPLVDLAGTGPLAAPRARPIVGVAPEIGAQTEAVLGEFRIAR